MGSRFLPGVGAHFIDWSRVTEPFDAAQPSMLLFDGETPDAKIVGLSYYTVSDQEPTPFRAGGAQWHRHAGLCIVHGALVAEGVTDRAQCDGGRGSLIPGRNVWMLHVWVVPEYPNSLGLYAPLNPALCSATAPCTPDRSVPEAPVGNARTVARRRHPRQRARRPATTTGSSSIRPVPTHASAGFARGW